MIVLPAAIVVSLLYTAHKQTASGCLKNGYTFSFYGWRKAFVTVHKKYFILRPVLLNRLNFRGASRAFLFK